MSTLTPTPTEPTAAETLDVPTVGGDIDSWGETLNAALQHFLDRIAWLADTTPGGGGHTVLSGADTPASEVGADGDFYIDTTAWDVYGPKANGAWGSGTSLIGPEGPQGAAGEAGADGDPGAGVPAGGSAGQVLQKASGADYDTEWTAGGGIGSTTITGIEAITQAAYDLLTPDSSTLYVITDA